MDTNGCCSRAEDADAVFHGQSMPNAWLWTACISGYAGGARECVAGLCEYEKLVLEDNMPDELTLTSVLSVCCHAGLVTQGFGYFHFMSKEYHLAAEPTHYILLDSLGRAGDLQRLKIC
ncbi:hypothetical protein L7F22_054129 [Adiantum nelumboides]|nr:hypothetical protein [Adiantum nelumboides]